MQKSFRKISKMSDHIEIPQVILDMINRELDKKRFEPKLCIKLVHHLCFEKNAKCLQSLESAWSSYFEDEEPFSIYQDKVHKIVHEALNGTKNKTFYFDMNQIWHDFTFDQANIYKDKHQYFETLISNNKKYLESNIFELNVLRFLSKLKAKDLVSMLKCIETIVAYYDDNDEDENHIIVSKKRSSSANKEKLINEMDEENFNSTIFQIEAANKVAIFVFKS